VTDLLRAEFHGGPSIPIQILNDPLLFQV